MWLKRYLAGREWECGTEFPEPLTRDVLEQSLALGRSFLLANQTDEGRFNYEYDFVTGGFALDDNQVRQAGALWGLALIHEYSPGALTRKALERGFRFWFDHSQAGPRSGTLSIAYPGEDDSLTGTAALVSLAIIEYLRAAEAGRTLLKPEWKTELERHLDGYIGFLQCMRLPTRGFARGYSLKDQRVHEQSSPYFDGETMLCWAKAARYAGYDQLVPMIQSSAKVLAERYTLEEWAKDPDSDQTKGFFQWSCMAFWEYQDAGWRDAEFFGDYVLALSWWMIHTHRVLERRRNTGYAYEGIIHGYRVAQARAHTEALTDLSGVIQIGLTRLISWQVGGPLAADNKFLSANPTQDPQAIGGVMNHRRESPLRVDVTQHQMHAVILALRHVVM